MKASQPSRTAVESAFNLWLQLTKATSGSGDPPRKLLNACATQGALAQYRSDEHQIRPLALNTLKVAAKFAVETGGWEALDALRKRVHLLGLNQNNATQRTNRSAVNQLKIKKDEIEELSNRNQKLLRNRTELLQAYGDIIDILSTFRALNPDLAERLKRHEAMFDIKVLSQTGGNDEQA